MYVLYLLAILAFGRMFAGASRREKIAVAAIVVLGSGYMVTFFWSHSCEDEPPPLAVYKSPRDWLIDRHGVGHRIGAALVRRSIVLLHRAEPSLRVEWARVVNRASCSWNVARVYPSSTDLRLEREVPAQPAGLVVPWLFGLIDGEREETPVAYWMDPDRWSALKGDAALPCAVCFDGDVRAPCPSMFTRANSREHAVETCAGARSD